MFLYCFPISFFKVKNKEFWLLAAHNLLKGYNEVKKKN
jgi:hypothetical protein